jgi:hypothetical protein
VRPKLRHATTPGRGSSAGRFLQYAQLIKKIFILKIF